MYKLTQRWSPFSFLLVKKKSQEKYLNNWGISGKQIEPTFQNVVPLHCPYFMLPDRILLLTKCLYCLVPAPPPGCLNRYYKTWLGKAVSLMSRLI